MVEESMGKGMTYAHSARISIKRHTRTAQEFRSEHLKDFLSLLSQHLTCEAQTSVLWILAWSCVAILIQITTQELSISNKRMIRAQRKNFMKINIEHKNPSWIRMIRTQRNNLLQIRVQRKNMACIQADANNTRTAQELYLDPSSAQESDVHTISTNEERWIWYRLHLSLFSITTPNMGCPIWIQIMV